MKTITTTLSIFALLLSTAGFSGDIQPTKTPSKPEQIFQNDIQPTKTPSKPEQIFNNEIQPTKTPSKPEQFFLMN